MLQPAQIILRPMITEKSTWEAQSRNRYAFEVHQDASKPMIRDAIAKLYNVRVVSVATQNRHGKYRRTKWGTFNSSRPRKAVVELHPDDKLELF